MEVKMEGAAMRFLLTWSSQLGGEGGQRRGWMAKKLPLPPHARRKEKGRSNMPQGVRVICKYSVACSEQILCNWGGRKVFHFQEKTLSSFLSFFARMKVKMGKRRRVVVLFLLVGATRERERRKRNFRSGVGHGQRRFIPSSSLPFLSWLFTFFGGGGRVVRGLNST